jgi:hypothetical protein
LQRPYFRPDAPPESFDILVHLAEKQQPDFDDRVNCHAVENRHTSLRTAIGSQFTLLFDLFMRIPPLLLITMTLGLALRLGGALLRPADLTADHDGYLAHAQMIEHGEGFAGPFTHRPTAFRPPAYPIVIAAVRSMDSVPTAATADACFSHRNCDHNV